MADKQVNSKDDKGKSTEKTKKVRRLKSQPTFREKAVQEQTKSDKPSKVKGVGSKVAKPFKAVAAVGKKEVYIGKNTKAKAEAGSFWHKKRSVIPGYFRSAWREVRLVTWPGRVQAWKLTLAVFVFSLVFGIIIAIADYGLDKLFRHVLLK